MGSGFVLVASALLLGPQAPPSDPVVAGVSLPAGRVASLLAGLPPGVRPRALEVRWPAWSDRSEAGWGAAEPWRRWVELVRAEQAAGASDPDRRAELAVLARLQGRDGDAWEHLLACASQPELVVTLLPLFTPGVPLASLGREGALPDGVLLTPALPPCEDARAGLRALAGRRIERREFEVGAARCALAVTVDRDGLELGLRHVAGGAARVRLLPPLPRGVEPGQLFADWEKLAGHEGPVEFALDAEANEHTLWLTFLPPEERWPNPRLETLGRPAGLEIVLRSPRGDEPYLARYAVALGELLGVPAVLRGARFVPPGPLEPLVLNLDAGPQGERKLVDSIGLAEAFVLLPRDR